MHQIGRYNHEEGFMWLEERREECPRQASGLLLPKEHLMQARKQAAYALVVSQEAFNLHKYKLKPKDRLRENSSAT